MMRKKLTLALVATMMTLAAWSQTEPNEPKPISLSSEELELVSGNNNFAFNLFRQARGDESIILSPLSITYALGMLNNGAQGQTQQEINQVLGFGSAGAEAINKFCHKLLTETGQLDELTRVSIANNIYMNTARGDVRMSETFRQTVADYYDVTPEALDFTDPATLDVINQWASDHTEGMIDKVLDASDLNPDYISYLLNAIYFKGEWTAKFDPEKTIYSTFDDGKKTAEMMVQDNEFLYTENDIFRSVILPYGNKAYQMTVFLPQYEKTLDDVVNYLNGTNWNNPSAYMPYQVYLGLPRFETETSQPLIGIMQQLGMPNAFQGGEGFDYFCENLDGTPHNVFIDLMKQVAKIKVNEEGTEAAAVTVIGETDGMVDYTDFIADRPFLYTISEQSTGVILFIGQYMGEELKNPRGEITLTEEEKQLVGANNDFAFNLFRKARGNESQILSPLSITYALGMLNNGTQGQTQQEICNTLGFGNAGQEAVNQFCRKMLTESPLLDKTTRVSIANTIFVNNPPYQLLPGFVQKAEQYYDATTQERDFMDGETLGVINQWASDHTEGMVKEVLDEQSFNPFAASYLLNAIYFKGAWASPFNPDNTIEEPFNGGASVPMMQQEMGCVYAENDICQAVRLPYGNEAYDISIFLPREGKSIGDVLNLLDGNDWRIKGEGYTVDLKLPRFETTTDLKLNDIMADLGMPTIFTPNAELMDMVVNTTDADESFYVSLMKQSAAIKLNEEGTEAAAVTVIGVEATSAADDYADFHATRPFLYIISEQSTGAIFFIGQFMGEPTGDSDDISRPTTMMQDERIYDLQGRQLKVHSSLPKGIFIQNGRKVVVK